MAIAVAYGIPNAPTAGISNAGGVVTINADGSQTISTPNGAVSSAGLSSTITLGNGTGPGNHAGGDYIINLGAGVGSSRNGQFQVNTTLSGAQTYQGDNAIVTLTLSGLSQDYAGQIEAFNASTYTDTGAFNYTGILRGTMGHVYIQTSGGTVSFTEGVAGVVNILAGAVGTLAGGYGTAGELIVGAVGYNITTFNGVQGIVGASAASTITNGNGVYGQAHTNAGAGATFTNPVGGYFIAQNDDSTTMTLAKGAEHVINLNDGGLGGAITSGWVTHSHYESQTTSTGIASTIILHNLSTNHRSATTIGTLQGINLVQNVINASGIITTLEEIKISLGTMTGTIPTHRGLRVANIGSAKTTTSEAIRIDAQSGSTGNSYSLNILGGQLSIENTGAAGLIDSTSQNLTVSTTTSGTLLLSSAGACNIVAGAASTLRIVAATGTAYALTDGTTNMYRLDSRIATDGVIVHLFSATAPTITSASGSLYHMASLNAYTVNLTGGTTVASMNSLQWFVQSPTIAAAQATTITAMTVNRFAGPIAGTNVTITTGGIVEIANPGAQTGTLTNLVGLQVNSLTQGGTSNVAIWVQNPIQIGNATANTTANQIHTATQGAATTQLFIGNASINVTSDVRLKTNIVNTERDALGILGKLRVVDYTWNDPVADPEGTRNLRGRWTGLIAQEAIDHIPWVVNKPGDPERNYYFMEYPHLIPLMVKGMQDLDRRLKAVEAR